MIKRIIPYLTLLALVLGIWLAPDSSYAQSPTPDYCLAPWEWVTPIDRSEPFWDAPFSDLRTGTLDMRTLPQQGTAGGVGMWGFFAYSETPPLPWPVGMTCYKEDLTRPLTQLEQDTILIRLNISVMSVIPNQSLGEMIPDLFLNHADPAGQTRWKPIRGTPRSGADIKFGDVTFLNGKVTESHPAFQNTLAVRLADYGRNARIPDTLTGVAKGRWVQGFLTGGERQDGITLTEAEARLRWQAVLERWTGHDMLVLHGRRGDDLLPLYVPQEYIDAGHKQRQPTTTFGDTFTDTDGVSLDAHTPTGPNAGTGWTEVVGTALEIQENLCSAAGAVTVSARLDDSLSSDDHYSQADVDISTGGDTSNDPRIGMAVRYAAAATTYYFGDARQSTSFAHRIYKMVAGTPTVLATGTAAVAPAEGLLKVQVDGSDLEIFWDGVSQVTVTDTAITGNLQPGLDRTTSINRTSTWDNFEAADLAAAPEPPSGDSQVIIID